MLTSVNSQMPYLIFLGVGLRSSSGTLIFFTVTVYNDYCRSSSLAGALARCISESIFIKPQQQSYSCSVSCPFRIDYHQGKANAAALSNYPQRIPKIFRASCFQASLFESHSFGPRPSGSLHFFNPIPTTPDPCLRNTCPAPILGHVLKRASRRPYKANVEGMRLRLQDYKEKIIRSK